MEKNISRTKIKIRMKRRDFQVQLVTEGIRGCKDRSRWMSKSLPLRLMYQNHDFKALRPLKKRERKERIVDKTAPQRSTRQTFVVCELFEA